MALVAGGRDDRQARKIQRIRQPLGFDHGEGLALRLPNKGAHARGQLLFYACYSFGQGAGGRRIVAVFGISLLHDGVYEVGILGFNQHGGFAAK